MQFPSILLLTLLITAISTISEGFSPVKSSPSPNYSINNNGNRKIPNRLVSTTASSSSSDADDILKPKYEIEPIALRIGHGFDIHRMAPIGDAGQPIVIADVTIDHEDQKVGQVIYTIDNSIIPFPSLISLSIRAFLTFSHPIYI